MALLQTRQNLIGWGPTQKVLIFDFVLYSSLSSFPSCFVLSMCLSLPVFLVLIYWATLKEKTDDWVTLKEDLKVTKREHTVSETLGNIVWIEENVRIQILQVHYSFIRFVLPT